MQDNLEAVGAWVLLFGGVLAGLAIGSHYGGAEGAIRGGLLAAIGLVVFLVFASKSTVDMVISVTALVSILVIFLAICSVVFFLIVGNLFREQFGWQDVLFGFVIEIVIFKKMKDYDYG